MNQICAGMTFPMMPCMYHGVSPMAMPGSPLHTLLHCISFRLEAEGVNLHGRSWPAPPSEEEMQALADATPGWAGADLKALCASAVLAAVRRSCPTSLEQLEAAVQHTEAGGINLQGPAQDSRRVLGDDLQVGLV